jgi:2-polyprenyl-3-methyl-5-hydroxy-6-metoxy-1,4-benzoquinol methylase
VKRASGTEILDADDVPAAVRHASMRDVTRSNTLLGGRRAAMRALAEVAVGAAAGTLLDVGTGLGDIAGAARRDGFVVIGVDTRPDLLRAARAAGRVTHAVCASALALPFRDASVDVALASQVLHHFDGQALVRFVQEMHRVARRAVVVSDLRRARAAAAGFWLASWPLRFHAVTRHDGVVSVRKGFTASEFSDLVRRATGARARVKRRLGFRLTAAWPAGRGAAAAPYALGEMPPRSRMTTVDELVVRAPLERIFRLAAEVERWPEHLRHYRFVRFRERTRDGGGLVEMSANRPFGMIPWPTWWTSLMTVQPRAPADRTPAAAPPAVRYRHIRGLTTGMEVEWRFDRVPGGTHVRIIHRWNGPPLPVIGGWVAARVIGPVFVHGIASRTLAGLAHVAERISTPSEEPR